MLWGSIAAEATAALGHTSKGKSGGANGRGYPSLAFRRHHQRTSREWLLQHHQRRRGVQATGMPKNAGASRDHIKTAKAVALTIPPSELLRTDQVIQ
jgi:hypothetical protein